VKALSIRQPWAWMILHAGKDIENRDWQTKFRGTVYIHASKWFRDQEVFETFQDMKPIMKEDRPQATIGDLRAMCGMIVGTVDIVDCVSQSTSPWFFGRYGFVLENPKPITPFPVKGKLNFFEVTQ